MLPTFSEMRCAAIAGALLGSAMPDDKTLEKIFMIVLTIAIIAIGIMWAAANKPKK